MKGILAIILFFFLIGAASTIVPATEPMAQGIAKSILTDCPGQAVKFAKFAADGKLSIYEYAHLKVACTIN